MNTIPVTLTETVQRPGPRGGVYLPKHGPQNQGLSSPLCGSHTCSWIYKGNFYYYFPISLTFKEWKTLFPPPSDMSPWLWRHRIAVQFSPNLTFLTCKQWWVPKGLEEAEAYKTPCSVFPPVTPAPVYLMPSLISVSNHIQMAATHTNVWIWNKNNSLKNVLPTGWRVGSAVKRTNCSSDIYMATAARTSSSRVSHYLLATPVTQTCGDRFTQAKYSYTHNKNR